MVKLIWAMTHENVIGKDNKIPWHIKEDLLYYKDRTKGQTVLMGEATYYSLKGYYKTRPLPYGKIYVASLNLDLNLEDAVVVNDAVSFLKVTKEDLWVVGGASIYKLALPYADELYVSFINKNYDGDTYFPKIDWDKFSLKWENKTEEVQYTIFERKKSV
ncbi:MAG: dihydrofolate reductase [Anaeroplasmataceae bacterium]|nr:dihydrofolate reductase [Anaeroplasmataceae bacterium]